MSNYHSLMQKSRFGSLRPLFAVLPHGSCGGVGGGGGRRSRLATPAAAFGSRSSSLVTTSRRQYNSHEFHNRRSSGSSCLSSTILFSWHPSPFASVSVSSSAAGLAVSNRQLTPRQFSYLKSHNGADDSNSNGILIIQNDDEKEELTTSAAAAAAAAQQWLTYSLPEGYCVGVALLQQQQQEQEQPTPEEHQQTSAEQHQQLEQQQQEQSSSPLPHGELLHSEEYNWGLTNMISSTSRTSYYLGRIALRLALKRLLLDNDDGDDDGLQQQQQQQQPQQPQQQKRKSQQKLNQKLWEEIITNPIQKDSFGRPILPELVVGSISHKGNYAVGLAAFHPLEDTCEKEEEGICEREDDDDDYCNKIIRWREDCPIYYNDDGSIIASSSSASSGSNSNSRDNNRIDGSSSNNNINQGRIGIGIDLERIDDTRGDRIQRKVLTKNEQSELGGLVDTCGISIGEEVTLRFSLKESVYKAMHPILCEYVGFQEAEITPLSNGSAKVILNLHSGSHERLRLVIRSISWRRLDDGFFLTTALVGCDGGVGVVDR